jgi:hypothetical protein
LPERSCVLIYEKKGRGLRPRPSGTNYR